MPYIEPEERRKLDGLIEKLEMYITSTGQLNYVITQLCQSALDNGHGIIDVSYDRINTVIGVLECVKQEFYRRVAAPYENEKAEQNGDVFYVL